MTNRISADIELAVEYGTDEALMIEYLRTWICFNRRLGKNLIDKRTWTYDTLQKISERTRIWTVKQVRRIIASLRKQGVLIVDHHSKWWVDRTNWYAFADELRFLGKDLAQSVTRKMPKPDSIFDQFVEQVAQAYNQVLAHRKLEVDPNNRRFKSYCEKLRNARPQTTAEEVKVGIEQILKDVDGKPEKDGLLRWKSLLHPNVLGKTMDRLANAPHKVPSTGPVKQEEEIPVIVSESYIKKLAELCTKLFPEIPTLSPNGLEFRQVCLKARQFGAGDAGFQLSMIEYALEEAQNWTWNAQTFNWAELLDPERLERLFDSRMDREEREDAAKRSDLPPSGQGVVIEGIAEEVKENNQAGQDRVEQHVNKLLDRWIKGPSEKK